MMGRMRIGFYGMACLVGLGLLACKKPDAGTDPAAGGLDPGARRFLGLRAAEVVPLFVTVKGEQSAGSKRVNWDMSTRLSLRLGVGANQVRVHQENGTPWSGRMAPAVFAGPVALHAVPAFVLDAAGDVAAIEAGAATLARIRELSARIPDAESVFLPVETTDSALRGQANTFWNWALFAWNYALSDKTSGAFQKRVIDVQLGSVLTDIEAEVARAIPCSGEDTQRGCIRVELKLIPAKVAVGVAQRRAEAFLPPGYQVARHQVREVVSVLVRATDRRLLEYTFTRDTTTLAQGEPGSISFDLRDHEQRMYRLY